MWPLWICWLLYDPSKDNQTGPPKLCLCAKGSLVGMFQQLSQPLKALSGKNLYLIKVSLVPFLCGIELSRQLQVVCCQAYILPKVLPCSPNPKLAKHHLVRTSRHLEISLFVKCLSKYWATVLLGKCFWKQEEKARVLETFKVWISRGFLLCLLALLPRNWPK